MEQECRRRGAPSLPFPRPHTLRRMSVTVRDQLRRAHFLEGLTESSLHQLAKLVEATAFDTDAILFSEGAPRRFMAIVATGAVAIEKRVNGRPVRLVTLGEGEAVGEGVLLD